MSEHIEVASFGPADVCQAAAARGESQLEAIEDFNTACLTAIRSDPQLDAQHRRDAEMARHAAENTPPSYDPAEMHAWLGGARGLDDEQREVGS